jgi:hypothetical protein
MSDTTLASIAANLSTRFEDDITSQINRSTVALQLLDVTQSDAHTINWNIRVGTLIGKTRPDGQDVDRTNDPQTDPKVPAQLGHGVYTEEFAVTGLALAGAAATGNPAALANVYGEELGDAIERFAKKVAIDVHSGTGSNSIHGMLAPSGPLRATGVYANVDRATYTQWAAVETMNGGVGRPLTLDLMREHRKRIYVASGKKPDLILCSPDVHMKYGQLLGQQRRYVQEVFLRGQKITLDGGYQMLEFDGIPVIEDIDQATINGLATMSFINSSKLKIKQLPDANTQITQGMAQVGVRGSAEEQFGMPTPKITARINPLGRNGDKFLFQLIAYLSMQQKQCNSSGVLGDINPNL